MFAVNMSFAKSKSTSKAKILVNARERHQANVL
jgi:hypothetical protein